jgi:hypothetical protein
LGETSKLWWRINFHRLSSKYKHWVPDYSKWWIRLRIWIRLSQWGIIIKLRRRIRRGKCTRVRKIWSKKVQRSNEIGFWYRKKVIKNYAKEKKAKYRPMKKINQKLLNDFF